MESNVLDGSPALFMGTGGLVTKAGDNLYWFNTPNRIKQNRLDLLMAQDDLVFIELPEQVGKQ